MQKFIFFISLLLLIQVVSAQKPVATNFSAKEAEMKVLGDKILKSPTQGDKMEANEAFINILEEVLSDVSSYQYPFDSLLTIARLTAPDNSFRIFNWHLAKEDGTFEFYGYVQPNIQAKGKRQQKKFKKPFYRLQNEKESKTAIENKVLTANEWFGAHYYKIVQMKDKNYVLLGWDGNNPYSNKKLIDVLTFSNVGEPKFGAAIFKMENNKFQKRVIFEYAKDASMSLRFNDGNMIIFDHLVPPNPNLKGSYSSYGPDFSYDAFEFAKGTWNYMPDIDARNNKSNADKKWTHPRSK
jgi:hypothetical protein